MSGERRGDKNPKKELKKDNLKNIIVSYQKEKGLSDAELREELKPIMFDLKFFTLKRFVGFYDLFKEYTKDSYNSFKKSWSFLCTDIGRGILSIFFAILLVLVLGVSIPILLLSMYSNSSYAICAIWIITMIALAVAFYRKGHHIWIRVSLITFSLSIGLFTAFLYEKNFVEEGEGEIDKAINIEEVGAENENEIKESIINRILDFGVVSAENNSSQEGNVGAFDIIALTLGISAILIAIFETLSIGLKERKDQKNKKQEQNEGKNPE